MVKNLVHSLGSWLVDITTDNSGPGVTTTLPLNDGTDGFRFKTSTGQKGIVRLTKKSVVNRRSHQINEDASASFCRNGTMIKLAGMGMRLYVEANHPVRPLHSTFAGSTS